MTVNQTMLSKQTDADLRYFLADARAEAEDARDFGNWAREKRRRRDAAAYSAELLRRKHPAAFTARKNPGSGDDQKSTEEMYRRGSGWQLARKRLHDQIIRSFLKEGRTTDTPHAVLMMGGPASGKSSVLKKMNIPAGYVHIDADAVKDMLPEYRKWTSPKGCRQDAAALVHEESSLIAKEIRNRAVKMRTNFLFDGTGKNADAYIDMVRTLQQLGYAVLVIMADLDVETAVKRAKLRATQTCRYVPESFLREAYKVIPKNFHRIAAEADEARLYSNRTDTPTLVWQQTGGTARVIDAAMWRRFSRGRV